MIDVRIDMNEYLRQLELETNSLSFRPEDLLSQSVYHYHINDVKLIASICCIHLAYTYSKCERFSHWDDRNKAASVWSHEHKNDFLNVFQGLTGQEFPWKPAEYRREQYFSRDIVLKDLSENIQQGITRWQQCHPTLQQSIASLFKKFLETTKTEGFTEDDCRFPLI